MKGLVKVVNLTTGDSVFIDSKTKQEYPITLNPEHFSMWFCFSEEGEYTGEGVNAEYEPGGQFITDDWSMKQGFETIN